MNALKGAALAGHHWSPPRLVLSLICSMQAPWHVDNPSYLFKYTDVSDVLLN